MNTKFLLPYQFKSLGWILFISGISLLAYALFFENEPDFLNLEMFALAAETFNFSSAEKNSYFLVVENNILDEIIELLLIIGGVCIAFSKNKVEDEFIAKLRLESLLWSTYINYGILILSILFIFEISFFYVLVANMFTILLLFIIRFNWVLIRSAKLEEDEK